jgi:hypothetical protein
MTTGSALMLELRGTPHSKQVDQLFEDRPAADPLASRA